MRRRPFTEFTALLLPVLAVTACSVETPSKVNVTATDTTCTSSKSEAKAGEITFEAENKGTIFTEVYLYGPGDRIMSERENIDPGQTKDFKIEVGGGDYEIACKPGMVGDGIRTKFTVTGTPDPRLSEPIDKATARNINPLNVNLNLADDPYVNGLPNLVPYAGQTINFHLTNTSQTQPRAFAVAGPDGVTLGDTGPIAMGGTADLSVTFKTPGTYTAFDSIGDHRQNGAEGTLTAIS